MNWRITLGIWTFFLIIVGITALLGYLATVFGMWIVAAFLASIVLAGGIAAGKA